MYEKTKFEEEKGTMSAAWPVEDTKKNSVVIGRLEEKIVSNFDGIYNYRLVEATIDGKIAVDNEGEETGEVLVWGSAELCAKMRRIEVGKVIKIIYDGKTKNPKGHTMKHFQVFSEAS